MDINGYETMTTFWQDFSIAERFGLKAVEDTYLEAKKHYSNDYEYWTEMCLVLNHKIWQHYETNEDLAILYDRLWREADELTCHWSEEAQQYYFQVTD